MTFSGLNLLLLDVLQYDHLVEADDHSWNVRDYKDDNDEEKSEELFLFVVFFLQNLF